MVRVSVVIPAYNAMDYLPEALNSVLSQTFEDYEVIIINDGSTDSIESWFSEVKDPRVKLISQANRGLAGARNTGIRESKGEYIAFLDADDCWHKTKLFKQINVLDSSSSIGLVYAWMMLVDQKGKPTGRFVKNNAQGLVWKDLILRNCVGSGSTPMVRKECFDRLGYFDENLGSYMEDRDMWLRLSPHYEFAVVKEVLVDYRQHPNSASKNWNAMARSAGIILDKAFDSPPSSLSEAEKENLRRQAWGKVSLALAWKPLQTKIKDYSKYESFIKEALNYDPNIRFSKEFIRISFTAFLMRTIGETTFQKALSRLHFFRQFFSLLKFPNQKARKL